jgi:2-polyprenyl-3-methyl-5-hydroxy-6-metoxy-1,4-benzoquinol methylase
VPPPSYWSQPRPDVAALVEGRGLELLELGCAEGRLGAALKTSGVARRVVGVERDPAAAARARASLDEVHEADLAAWTPPFPPETFDGMIAADVLEHLPDPEAVLAAVLPAVRPGGQVIVSVPNVRYFKVVSDLVFHDEFRYTSWGVLDRTHCRLFTRRSACRLLVEVGLRVEAVRLNPPPSWKGRLLRALTLGLAPSFFSEQVLIRARKP